jgi:hypothetical protein
VSRLTAGSRARVDVEKIRAEPFVVLPGVDMKAMNFAILSLLAVAACETRPGADETGRAGEAVDAADTIVTTDQTQDTTIVTHDTTVNVDTTSVEGDKTVKRDTLQR